MTSFSIGAGILNSGHKAGNTLLNVISEISELVDLGGISPQEAVEKLISGNLGNLEKTALKAIQTWLAKKGSGKTH